MERETLILFIQKKLCEALIISNVKSFRTVVQEIYTVRPRLVKTILDSYRTYSLPAIDKNN